MRGLGLLVEELRLMVMYFDVCFGLLGFALLCLEFCDSLNESASLVVLILCWIVQVLVFTG